MREQLIAINERLQPFLGNANYSFIAPVNPQLFTIFMENANRFAPVVAILRSVHHALGNRQATARALELVGENIPLRIYVITRVANNQILMNETIGDYCRNNNIDLALIGGAE